MSSCKYTLEGKTYNTANAVMKQYDKRKKEEYDIVESKLKSIINQFGISIQAMDDYIVKYGNPFNNKVAAFADLSRKIIAVNESNNNILSEEFAHIIIGNYRGQPSYNKAMNLVENTNIYKDNFAKYNELYNGDITKIKEEILGKIMSDIVLQQVQTPRGYNSIVLHLKRLFEKFKSLFTKDKTDYIKSELDFIAKNIFIDKVDLNPTSGVFANAEQLLTTQEEVEEDFKIKALKQLTKELSSRAGRLSGTETKAETRERLKVAIDLLSSNIERVQYDTAITEFAKHLSEEIARVLEAIDGKSLSQNNIGSVKDFLGVYEPYVKFLKENVNEQSKELVQPIIDGMRTIEDKFYTENERLSYITTKEYAEGIHGKEALDKLGLNLSIFKEFRTTFGHYFNYLLGNTSHSSEPIVQLVYDVISRVKIKTRNKAKNIHKEYVAKLDALGVLGKNTKELFTKASVSSDTKKILREISELKGVIQSMKDVGTATTQAEELLRDKIKELEESKKTSIAKFIGQYDMDKYNEASRQFWDAHKVKYGYTDYGKEKEIRSKNKKANKEFFQEVKEFYDTHTEKASKEFIEQTFKTYGKDADNSPLVKKGIWTKQQWQDWHDRNSREYQGEIIYDRGIFSRPKLSLYRDKQYDKLDDKQKEALELLKSWKRDTDLMYNREPNDNVPSVIQSLLDIAYYEREGMTDKLSSQFKETFTKGIEDEAVFGNTYNTVANDKFYDDGKIPTIPVLYTNPIKHDDVTTDIIGAMMMYHESALNFVEMSEELPKLSIIMDGLRRSTGFKKDIFGTEKKVGRETSLYKGLSTFLQMNMFGQYKDALTVGNINVTKAIDGIVNYTRTKNLGWNVWSAFSGLMSASVGTYLQAVSGRYFTKDDAIFGLAEFNKNLPDIISQRGKINNKNKLMVLVEAAGLADEAAIYRNIDKSQITKNTASSAIYAAFQAAGYPTRATITASTLNNIRLVGNQWVSEFNYRNNTENYSKEKWQSFPTMYDNISVNEIGQVILSDNLQEKDYVKALRRIETISNELEGSMSDIEKGKIHQSPLGSVVGMHRGFFFNNLFKAFKADGYNATLDGYDVGNHRQFYATSIAYILNQFTDIETIQGWDTKTALWENLKPYQKKAWMLAFHQNAAVMVFAVVGYALMKIGEDEDDPVLNHVMYLADKTLLEMSSIAPLPFGAFTGEIFDTVDSPLLPLKILRQQANILDLVFGWNEEVERGAWKGNTKAEKALFQMIPIVSQWGKLTNPDQSSQYLRMNKLSPYYNTFDAILGYDD